MPIDLLSTKSQVSPPAGGQVGRPRLLQRLDRLLQPGGRLLVLSAPAGFGKSSLLGAWVAGKARDGETRFAWFSLDPEDNEPVGFLGGIALALRRSCPGSATRR